jgi:3-methyladenine DNA glycosylase AlkD
MEPRRRALAAGALERRLKRDADPRRVAVLQRFFKTGPGEYAEGDRFLGLTVPQIRAAAAEFKDLPVAAVDRLLDSPWHELRSAALLILAEQYRRGSPRLQRDIYARYVRHTGRINNWDLVDLSAPAIVGAHLMGRSIAPLRRLARSRSLWERRIAIVATQAFIRRGRFDVTLEIAERLLGDREDLIHKAAGWMLREVGKRDAPALAGFLDRHASAMPRTMLRYAIERLPPTERRQRLRATSRSDSRPSR